MQVVRRAWSFTLPAVLHGAAWSFLVRPAAPAADAVDDPSDEPLDLSSLFLDCRRHALHVIENGVHARDGGCDLAFFEAVDDAQHATIDHEARQARGKDHQHLKQADGSHDPEKHVRCRQIERHPDSFPIRQARAGALSGCCRRSMPCATLSSGRAVPKRVGFLHRSSMAGELRAVCGVCRRPRMETYMADKTYWNTIKAESGNVLGKVKAIIHEGNVRRLVVKHDGRTVAEFPLTAGVVGAVLAP